MMAKQICKSMPPKSREDGLPANKCPICLEDILNLAISHDCNHSFCYGCINEWIRNHNKCPLCRRIILNVRHNFRSKDDFDVIEVLPPTFHEEFVSRISDNYFFIHCPEQTGLYLIFPVRHGRYGQFFYNTRYVNSGQSMFIHGNPGTLFVLPEDYDQVIRQLENANIFQAEIPWYRHSLFLRNHRRHQ